jgi:hypothetical protein
MAFSGEGAIVSRVAAAVIEKAGKSMVTCTETQKWTPEFGQGHK